MSIDWKILIDGLALTISVGAMVYAFFVNRRKDVDDRLASVDARLNEGSRRMDRIDNRVQQAERTIETMPGKDDVHALQLTLSEMRGDMRAQTASMTAMAESLKRLESITSRHEDHLRDNHR